MFSDSKISVEQACNKGELITCRKTSCGWSL